MVTQQKVVSLFAILCRCLVLQTTCESPPKPSIHDSFFRYKPSKEPSKNQEEEAKPDKTGSNI